MVSHAAKLAAAHPVFDHDAPRPIEGTVRIES